MPSIPGLPEEWRDGADLAQGILAGLVTDQVERRGRTVIRIGVVVAVLGIIGAIVGSGGWRVLAVLMVLAGAGVAAAVWVARRLAVRAIARFAAPVDLGERREAIASAIDTAALPSGPISALRFLYRVRKGPGPELDRLRTVLDQLRTQLRATD